MGLLLMHSFNESFTPAIFENTPLISQLHDNTMRFGNPKEVVYALIPPETDSSSFFNVGGSKEFLPIPNDYRVAYFIGASSWSVIILSTFITWIIIIIICICIDNRKPLFILSGGYTPSSRRRQHNRGAGNRSTTEVATMTSSHLLSPISTRPCTSYEEEMSYHDNDNIEISTTTATEKDDFPQSRQVEQDDDSSIILTSPTDAQHTTNNHEAPPDNGGIMVHDEAENSIIFDHFIGDNHSMVLDQYHAESPPPIENIDIERRRLQPRGPIVLIRAIVLFCGLGSIIASLLFLFKGIHLAMVAVDDVDTSLDVAHHTFEKASAAMNSLVEKDWVNVLAQLREYYEQCTVLEIHGILIEELNQLLPFVDSAYFLFNRKSSLAAVSQHMETSQQESFLDITRIGEHVQSSLSQVSEMIITIQSSIQSITPLIQMSAIIYVILISTVITSIILIVIQASRKRLTSLHYRLHMCLLHPFFGLLVALSWFLAASFIFVSVVTADFCIDSPDWRVKYLLNSSDDVDPTVYEFLEFYISGCTVDSSNSDHSFSGPAFFHETIAAALTGISDAHTNLDKLMAQGHCTNTTVHDDMLHELISTLTTAQNVTSCATWNPIYKRIANDALCYNGLESFAWIFSTQVVVAVLCTTIVTLPVALRLF